MRLSGAYGSIQEGGIDRHFEGKCEKAEVIQMIILKYIK